MSLLVQGEPLAQEEQRKLEGHIAECEMCRRRWEEEQGFIESLETTFHEIPQRLTSPKARVLEILELSELPREKREATFWKKWRTPLGILVLSLILLAALAYLSVFVASKVFQQRLRERFHQDLQWIGTRLIKNPKSRPYRRDPWGKSYRVHRVGPQLWLIYSVGQNGRDEGTQGDDLWAVVQIEQGKLSIIDSVWKRSRSW